VPVGEHTRSGVERVVGRERREHDVVRGLRGERGREGEGEREEADEHRGSDVDDQPIFPARGACVHPLPPARDICFAILLPPRSFIAGSRAGPIRSAMV